METDPLHITLETLRSERVVTESRAIELKDELDLVGQRLANLRGAIENIEALLVDPKNSQAPLPNDATASRNGEDSASATPRTFDFSATPDPRPRVRLIENEPHLRKRVPSTDWVAEAVSAIGQPAGRDAIYDKFVELKGIPESWVSNPRNSFNNALGRAVERRMILKISDSEYAPIDFNPFGERDFPQDEGF